MWRGWRRCEAGESAEGLLGLPGDGLGRLVAVAFEFEGAGRGGGQRGGRGADSRPGHGSGYGGAGAGPEVLVLHVGVRGEGAVVVVNVELRDALTEQLDRGADTRVPWRVFDGLRQVQVAEVEADADGVEVAGAENVER